MALESCVLLTDLSVVSDDLCSVLWLRVVDMIVRKMILEYITRVRIICNALVTNTCRNGTFELIIDHSARCILPILLTKVTISGRSPATENLFHSGICCQLCRANLPSITIRPCVQETPVAYGNTYSTTVTKAAGSKMAKAQKAITENDSSLFKTLGRCCNGTHTNRNRTNVSAK